MKEQAEAFPTIGRIGSIGEQSRLSLSPAQRGCDPMAVPDPSYLALLEAAWDRRHLLLLWVCDRSPRQRLPGVGLRQARQCVGMF